MRLLIEAAPRTKKNHGSRMRMGTRTLHLPSEAFLKFQAIAVPQLRRAWAGLPAITRPVNVRAMFYRDALRGDACGYYQALADVLERAGVVEDDVLCEQWDGSRLRKDADHPRIEVELEEVVDSDRVRAKDRKARR